MCFWQVGWQEAMKVLATTWANKMGCRRWIGVEYIREYWFCFCFFALKMHIFLIAFFELQCSRC